jgi:hypothetical protein
MNPLFWFTRMARWAHRPPSARRVAIILAVIALCLALAALERFVGWPAWLSVNPPIRRAPHL